MTFLLIRVSGVNIRRLGDSRRGRDMLIDRVSVVFFFMFYGGGGCKEDLLENKRVSYFCVFESV